MNVQVRILTLKARQEIKRLEADLRRLQASAGTSGRGFGGAARGADSVGAASRRMASSQVAARKEIDRTTASLGGMMNVGTKAGNQLQWTGRQLQYNFAIPLALVGGMAVNAAFDTERAMVRVRKVYGDSTIAASTMRAELEKLEQVFTALSNKFGVHREQVIGIAGDWAAAGASGAALAKGVNLTLQAMVLGEIEAAEATSALIAIQAQYGYNTTQLTQTLADLNVVENETGVRMRDLIQAMSRSAAVARQAGVDHRHLAAFVAALVPAAGTAATAGNGLKTMITRLMAPTNEAADAMQKMGVNIYDTSWQSLNAAQRFEKMAEGFKDLTEGQRIYISDLVAGKWQISKFAQVMADVGNKQGYYWRALSQTEKPLKTMKVLQEELNEVLGSSPQKWRQTGVIMQNALADVMIPLLPYIVFMAQKIAQLAQAFSDMNPYAQAALMGLAGFLLIFGPLIRYLGSSITLFATLGDTGKVIAGPLTRLAQKFLGLGRASKEGAEMAEKAVKTSVWSKVKHTVAGGQAEITATSRTQRALMAVTATGRKGIHSIYAAGTAAILSQGRVAGAVELAQQRRKFIVEKIQTAAHMATQKSTWAAFNAWSLNLDATTKARLIALDTAALGKLRTMDDTFIAWTKAKWAAFRAGELGAQAAADTAQTVQKASLMARLRAMDDVAIATTKVKYSAFRAWMAGGDAGWKARMVALDTTTKARLIALDTAFLTATRAKWATFWASMVGMQQAASAKMVATDTATKAKLASSKFLMLFRNPWFLAFAAVLGAAYYFRDDIARIFENIKVWISKSMAPVVGFFQRMGDGIVSAFNRLPQGIQNALMAVVRIVAWAAQKVYDLFSYLNPFARHSPSLVEQVTKGMAEIKRQYASVGSAGSAFAAAARDLKLFKAAASALGRDEWADQRMEVKTNLPSMLGIFNTMVGHLGKLNSLMATQAAAIDKQENVVAGWQAALEEANYVLDAQQLKLDALKDHLDSLTATYDSHKQAMEDFANAPLVGMRAMSDAIFENEMAQKRLQLSMMDWEDQNGSIEEYMSNLASLRGDIETLRGSANELRLSGAGSDVLGPIEDQIAQMEGAAKVMEGTVQSSPIGTMTKELEKLERQGQRLGLEQSLAFDPLTRQIEQAANMTKELSFEEIISGINRERDAMAALQPAIDAATAAVRDQELAVNAAKAARDAIQASYDFEKTKLEIMQDEYRKTEELIRGIEGALRDMGSAAKQVGDDAAKAAKDAAGKIPEPDMFAAAAVADFPDVGGTSMIGREGTDAANMAELDAMIETLTHDTAKQFGSIDFLGPIKNGLNTAREWIMNTGVMKFLFGDFTRDGKEPLSIEQQLWNALNPLERMREKFPMLDRAIEATKKAFGKAWDWIATKAEVVREILGALWRLVDDDVKQAFSEIYSSIMDVWNELGKELAQFATLLEPLRKAWDVLWPALKVAFFVVIGILLLAWKTVWSVMANTVGPVMDLIIGVVTNAFQILRGIIEVVLALISGDWSSLWNGLVNIVSGTFGLIWAVIEGAGRIIWGVVSGIVEGIVDFFKWLYDELVGHSIVPDIVNGVIEVFKTLGSIAQWIWNNVLKPIFEFFVSAGKFVVNAVVWLVQQVWNNIKFWASVAKWVYDNVLSPVFGFFKSVGESVIGAVKWLVDRVWESIKFWASVGRWVYDNVLNPIFGFFGQVGGWIISKAVWIKDQIIRGFHGLLAIVGWIRANVLDPIGRAFGWMWDNAVRPLLNRMLRGIANIFNSVGEGIARGINVGLSAIDKLIDGLNWIGKNVPGLNFQMRGVGRVVWSGWTPPQFAKGGMLPTEVGAGFKTNGARAIVGEGRAAYPEYVIPTDPRFRDRARSLLFKAAGDVAPEVAEYARGGTLPPATGGPDVGAVLGGIRSAAGSALGTVRRGAVIAAMAGPLKAFDALMGTMDPKPRPAKDLIMRKKNDIYNWMKGVDGALPTTPPPGQVGNEPVNGAGWSAIENFLRTNGNVLRNITSTFRAGDDGYHGRGRAVDYSVAGHRQRGYNDTNLRNIFNALLPIAGNLRELILAGAPFNIKNGRQVPGYAWGEPGSPGNHWNHVHAALAEGGIVTGPTKALIGEAGPEAVLPLTVFWNKLDDGFNRVVITVKDLDFNEAMRTARVETSLLASLSGVKLSVDNVGLLLDGTIRMLDESLAEAIAVSFADGFSLVQSAQAEGMASLQQALVDGFTTFDQSLQSTLGTIQDLVSQIPKDSGYGGGAPGVDMGMPPGTIDTIRKMFTDAGVSIGLPSESEIDRLNRIASEVDSGMRSIESVQHSINLQKNTVDMVRQMFRDAGVAIATATETEQQRLARIARDIDTGARTAAQVQHSINLQKIPGLATGGLVKASNGGTIVRLGEGGQDEWVVPANRARRGGDDDAPRTVEKNYNFYGNLEFPNITSGADAETFIRNLEAMVD